jgi:hypothetical protein
MLTGSWMLSITALCRNSWIRFLALTLYYSAIIAGLIWLYGKGDFSTPKFVYQGF